MSSLRYASYHRPGAPAEYVGVSFNAGSRDDPASLPGLAHFVEHTIFKGTRRHRASYIRNHLESLGGELNAFTTKEETCVYAAVPAGCARAAAELIGELVTESVFPADELDKEREVVLDEIASYRDSPADAVADDFEDLLFEGSPLGHNILGTADAVRSITPADCRRHMEELFTAANAAAFYSGPEDGARMEAMMRRAFAALPEGEGRGEVPAAPFRHFDITESRGLHQAHTMLGALIDDAPRRMTLRDRLKWMLLSNLLGGPGMNSLLNVELREKGGLVYAVDSSLCTLSDSLTMQIYFGCDPADVGRCLRRLRTVLARVASGTVTAVKLERAKRQFLGQMRVAADNAEGRALALGRQIHLYGGVPSAEEVRAALATVTAGELSAAAAQLSAPGAIQRLTLV